MIVFFIQLHKKRFDCLCVCFVLRGEPEVCTHAGGHAAASGGGARPADVSAPGAAGEGATAPLSGERAESYHQPEKKFIPPIYWKVKKRKIT